MARYTICHHTGDDVHLVGEVENQDPELGFRLAVAQAKGYLENFDYVDSELELVVTIWRGCSCQGVVLNDANGLAAYTLKHYTPDSGVNNVDDELSFIRAIYASPEDMLPRLIYTDWLDEHGRVIEATLVRSLADQRTTYRHFGLNTSSGYGSGYGYGDGDGDGYGYDDGYGDSYGDSYGDGYGDGYGYGDGDGYGDGYHKSQVYQLKETEMKPGRNYLFYAGEGWAYVGEYVGPNGLGTHEIRKAANICRTGGVSWFHLARGENRGDPIVRIIHEREDEGMTIPTPIAIPWHGDLYTEDQN